MKALKQCLLNPPNLSDEEKEKNAFISPLIHRLITGIWSKGYLPYVLSFEAYDYTGIPFVEEIKKSSLVKLPTPDSNYIDSFPNRDRVLPLSLYGKYELSENNIVMGDAGSIVEFNNNSLCITAQLDGTGVFSAASSHGFNYIIRPKQSKYDPEPHDVRRTLILERHKTPEFKLFYDNNDVIIGFVPREGEGRRIVIGRGPRVFMEDGREGKFRELTRVGLYEMKYERGRRKRLTPIPNLGRFTVDPSTPRLEHFIVGGRRVIGYRNVFTNRSVVMRDDSFFTMGNTLFPDEKWNPPIEYAWNYINGIDNLLSLGTMGIVESLRVIHYLNYFIVSLTSDLFDAYLVDLCNKILETAILHEKEVLDLFNISISKIDQKSRELLTIFHSTKYITGGLADRVVAKLATSTDDIKHLFTLPYNSLAGTTAIGYFGHVYAIYSMEDKYGNKPDLLLPIFKRTAKDDELLDEKYSSIRIKGDGMVVQPRYGMPESYDALKVVFIPK